MLRGEIGNVGIVVVEIAQHDRRPAFGGDLLFEDFSGHLRLARALAIAVRAIGKGRKVQAEKTEPVTGDPDEIHRILADAGVVACLARGGLKAIRRPPGAGHIGRVELVHHGVIDVLKRDTADHGHVLAGAGVVGLDMIAAIFS